MDDSALHSVRHVWDQRSGQAPDRELDGRPGFHHNQEEKEEESNEGYWRDGRSGRRDRCLGQYDQEIEKGQEEDSSRFGQLRYFGGG